VPFGSGNTEFQARTAAAQIIMRCATVSDHIQ